MMGPITPQTQVHKTLDLQYLHLDDQELGCNIAVLPQGAQVVGMIHGYQIARDTRGLLEISLRWVRYLKVPKPYSDRRITWC